MSTAPSENQPQPKIAIVMGSQSDWTQMKGACDVLDALQVPYTKAVVSAHRMPDHMFDFAKKAQSKGYDVIIAGAGGAAHLPGMIASQTILPVIGVPIKSSTLNGIDSLLSIVQMPGGVPVGTMAIGASGAKNAGLYAARIVAIQDTALAQRLLNYHQEQMQLAIESNEVLND